MEITHELFPTLFSTSSSASVFITCSLWFHFHDQFSPSSPNKFVLYFVIHLLSSVHLFTSTFLFLCLCCISHVSVHLGSCTTVSISVPKTGILHSVVSLFIKTVLLFSISFLSSIYLRFRNTLTAVRLFVTIYRQTNLTLCFSFVYSFSFCSFFVFILPFILLTVVCWFNKFVIEFFILSLHLVYSTFFFTILYLHV